MTESVFVNNMGGVNDMSFSAILISTPKRYREAVVVYGKFVADLMWDYCELIRIQSEINGDSAYIRRKRQRIACASIAKDFVRYGDPRLLNNLVIGDLGEHFLTADEIAEEKQYRKKPWKPSHDEGEITT